MRRLAGVEASTGSLARVVDTIGHCVWRPAQSGSYRVYVLMVTRVWMKAKSGKRPWRPRNSARQSRGHRGSERVFQQTGPTRKCSISARWHSGGTLGWFTQESTAHDLTKFLAAFQKAAQTKGKPSAIVARTVEGIPNENLLSDPNHHEPSR